MPAENDASAAFQRLDAMLARIAGADLHLLRRHLRYYMGTSALEHLLKVASGIDSVNLGENEIAGQIARAYDLARSAGSTDFLLNLAFQHALRRARKLRSKAGFSGSGLSYATLAASEAERRIREEGLKDPVILLIGAGGQLGSAIMKTVLSRDLGRLRITVRRGGRGLAHRAPEGSESSSAGAGSALPCLIPTTAGSALASNSSDVISNASASVSVSTSNASVSNSGPAPALEPVASGRVEMVDYARRYESMRDADIIISCTASPHHTVTYREFLEAADPGRKYLLEDLSLPRDVDADLASLSNVALKDFAWFSALAASHRRQRLGGARLIAHDLRSEAEEVAGLIRRKVLERDSLPRLAEFLESHDGKTLFYLLQKAATDPQELETLMSLASRGAACSRNLRRRD